MSRLDPDVAGLIAGLGLRGMRYRSFGNRPTGIAGLPPPEPTAPAVPPAATPAEAAAPGIAPASVPPPAPAPLPPPSAGIRFPLLVAALDAASAAPVPVAAEGTLAFLGLRRAGARDGG